MKPADFQATALAEIDNLHANIKELKDDDGKELTTNTQRAILGVVRMAKVALGEQSKWYKDLLLECLQTGYIPPGLKI